MRDNRERIKAVQSLLGEAYSSMRSADTTIKLDPTPIQDITSIRLKIDEIAKAHPEYFARGYRGIVAVSKENGYMSTTMDGLISVNFATDKNGFNAGESLLSAFEKLKGNSPLTFNEEYSIEVLWHEILHNKSKNTAVLPPIDSHLGFPRCVAENINQYIARSSYGDFLRQLGRDPIHTEAIMTNGYSYNYTLQNLRKILDKAKIKETDFLKEAEDVLMNDYTDIDEKIGKILKQMVGENNKSNVVDVLNGIEFRDFEDSFLKILN